MSAPGLARRLGILDDAERVLILAESSHWDPNWMLTSEQYFRFGVRRTLDRVLDELDRDERRVWSADCLFFLAMYWQRRPARREQLAAAIESRRLRLTTSGVTTQDTLLPSTESVLRDFLVGQEWLRARGLTQEPRLAYFPDSFGHSPSLPSILRAAGFDRTIVTRIDGAHFLGSDWEPARRFPRPGSSAEALVESGSADFVWRDRSGAEVLAHWHRFTYGQGDMLAAVGPLRYMSLPTAVPDRSPRRVAARIERYAKQLAPLARTRYLLCPIGLDFVDPIPDLLGLIDRYNEQSYPSSGVWVANAGADDHLALVEEHRAELPVLELDPNPYWTGFYASRPELKRSHRSLVDRLVAVEARTVVHGTGAEAARLSGELAEPWWTAVAANHHDFVTGTSPDRVVRAEQRPWLDAAHSAVGRIELPEPEPAPAPHTEPGKGASGSGAVRHEWDGGRLTVDAGAVVAVVDAARGGCLTEVCLDGEVVLTGLGADVVAYDDSGGLWRMGCEYKGGRFVAVDRMSRHRAEVRVEPTDDGCVEVVTSGTVDGAPAERIYRFAPGRPSFEVRTTCTPGERRTLTLSIPTPSRASRVHMDQPGGLVTRPIRRLFDPTFWPAGRWFATDPGDPARGRGLALGLDMTRAVSASGGDRVEVVVARNAPKERAWGVLPIPACPARGHEPDPTTATVDVWWPAEPSPVTVAREGRDLGTDDDRRGFGRLVAGYLELTVDDEVSSGEGLEVLALKPADRGEGVIVRFIDWDHQPGRRIRLRMARPVAGAVLCDARERDIQPLDPTPRADGTEVVVETHDAITSVRLVFVGPPEAGR